MPEISSQSGSQSSGLLSLPLEIREEIYSYLLLRNDIEVQSLNFKINSWIRHLWENNLLDSFPSDFLMRKTGILCVSRQINTEAASVLYGRNLFIVHINCGTQKKLLKLGTANMQRIRYLRLVAKPTGLEGNPMNFNIRLWIPLFIGLNRLCLVAKQPLLAGSYQEKPCLEEDVWKWIALLEPTLRCLAQNVPETTIVEVDDNDLAETSEAVKRCFRTGYKKVQTVTGDSIFHRGNFSSEALYWDASDGDSE